jgi:hypothetical protein
MAAPTAAAAPAASAGPLFAQIANEASPRVGDRQADPPAAILILFGVTAPAAAAAAALCNSHRAGSSRELQ